MYDNRESCLTFPHDGVQYFRHLEAQDHLRRKQAEVAAERRAELAAEKAALLQARIDRGVRVRRAQQLRNERLAAQKADEREAATEAARRYVVAAALAAPKLLYVCPVRYPKGLQI